MKNKNSLLVMAVLLSVGMNTAISNASVSAASRTVKETVRAGQKAKNARGGTAGAGASAARSNARGAEAQAGLQATDVKNPIVDGGTAVAAPLLGGQNGTEIVVPSSRASSAPEVQSAQDLEQNRREFVEVASKVYADDPTRREQAILAYDEGFFDPKESANCLATLETPEAIERLADISEGYTKEIQVNWAVASADEKQRAALAYFADIARYLKVDPKTAIERGVMVGQNCTLNKALPSYAPHARRVLN